MSTPKQTHARTHTHTSTHLPKPVVSHLFPLFSTHSLPLCWFVRAHARVCCVCPCSSRPRRNVFQDHHLRVMPIVLTQVRSAEETAELQRVWDHLEESVLGTETVREVMGAAQWSSSFVNGRKSRFRPFEKIAGLFFLVSILSLFHCSRVFG